MNLHDQTYNAAYINSKNEYDGDTQKAVPCTKGFIAGVEWERRRDKWINPSDELPPRDEADGVLSIDVWTYTAFGMRIGRYSYSSGNWVIDGVYSGKKILVVGWQNLPEPPKLKSATE